MSQLEPAKHYFILMDSRILYELMHDVEYAAIYYIESLD